jgi:exodeoxyribonuclease-5
VAQLNQKIRTAIYGEQVPRFVVGERLLAINPCLEDETVILPTSAECEVLEVHRGREGQWPIWVMTVETDEGDCKTLHVLHESAEIELKLTLDLLAQERRWIDFWELKQRFHEVDYAYSLTIHKSQGSTFQDVFVDVRSMSANRNVVERNQLCYVAFTRAAKRLFLYQ